MGVLNYSKRFNYFLFVLILFCSYSIAAAGQRQKPPAVLSRPGTGLNKIFSTSSAYGPLGQDRNLVEESRMLLLWNDPPSITDTTYDAFHYQILGYNPVSKQLSEYGSLSGDSVTDAATGALQPAIQGNMNSISVAGDMIGDGYAEEASVWETAGHRVFVSAMPVSKTNLAFENGKVVGDTVGYLSSTLYSGQIEATLADLTGDGQKDLVVAWNDATTGKLTIAVYGWSQTAASHLTLISSIADMSGNPLFSLAAGDFKHDGRDEIALGGDNGQLFIKLYYLDNSDNLVGAAESTFPTTVSLNGSNGPDGSIQRVVMATGDLTGDNYKDCIALAYTASGGVSTNLLKPNPPAGGVFVARPDTSLDSIAVSNTASATGFLTPDQSGLLGSTDAISMQCGDLMGTGTDQIVIGTGNEVKVFKVKPNGGYLLPVVESTTSVPGPAYDPIVQDYYYSDSYLRVGDVNRDGKDEVVVLRNIYSSVSSGVQQYLDLTVLAATDTSYGMTQLASLTDLMPDTVNGGSALPYCLRHYSLALGNFDQAGLRLGQPTLFHADSVIQPLVILNAPPVQFDVFNDTSFDICNAFNGGSNAGAFSATYNQSTTNSDMMSTTVNSSWGVGASLSGEAGYAGVSVKASLDTHYGQNFSKEQNSSYKTSVAINVSAQEEDEIYAIMDNYDVWEYPLLDSGQVRGHVVVTVPGPPQGEWFNTESWAAYSYVPDHVVGNVLSYLTYDSLAGNPYMYQKIKGSLSDGWLLGSSTYSWSLNTSDFTSDNASETQTFSLNVSAEATVGSDFGGIGASVSVGVSGNYSKSGLTSHTSSVTSNLGLQVNLGTINQSIGEDAYTVTPYSYWGDDGALVIDYAVDPEVATPGNPLTWWQKMYGEAPDPAFALPYLNWPEEGKTVEDPAQLYETKEIFCSPQNPAPGDTVSTTVRVHNYSLIATTKPVYTSFYLGSPQNGGTIIKDLSGDSVFATTGPIAARGWQVFSFKWVAPSTVNSNLIHDAEYVHLWGVVDSTSTMNEIHKRNDMAWSLLDIPGITTGVEGHTNLPASFRLYQNYPNPFNPTTVIRFDLNQNSKVALDIYNVLGQKVMQRNYGTMNAGSYNESINMDRFASGVYFYRIVADGENGKNFVAVKKLMLVK